MPLSIGTSQAVNDKLMTIIVVWKTYFFHKDVELITSIKI